MPVTVGVNGQSVIHAGSGGVTAVFPDICKTPMAGAQVPIPYPNVAKSSDTAAASKKVTCDGNPVCVADSNFSTSTGDEAGKGGGVVSGTTKGKAQFVGYSMDVKIEGKGVPRNLDRMFHNDNNTAASPVVQPPVVVPVGDPEKQAYTQYKVRLKPR